VTYSVPKQLIPIAGKPVLYHVLDLLPPEVDSAVLATGYKADVIEAYVRDHPPRIPVTTIPESEPLGTGGGMRNAGDTMSDPFLLLNSDVIAALQTADVVARHQANGGLGTMVLTEVEDTSPYGVAALDHRDRIVRFVEKPAPAQAPSHWINAGVAVWRRSVLEAIPRGRPVSFEREVLPELLAQGVYGYRSRGFWEDAGTPDRLLRAQRLLFDAGRGLRSGMPTGASGTGPVAFGEGCEVRGAVFGQYVSLGDNVEVGHGTLLDDSVIMDEVSIGSGARVVHSVVGPGVEVEEGAVVEGEVLARDNSG
jgi:mannose-1-phosphate guanylyltransferase